MGFTIWKGATPLMLLILVQGELFTDDLMINRECTA
jgi:hypothetical protein